MQFISRYNTSFMSFVYKKYNRIFRNYEFYSEFLLENCPDRYYETLEGDLKAYCDWQTERRMKNAQNKTANTRAQNSEARPCKENTRKF